MTLDCLDVPRQIVTIFVHNGEANITLIAKYSGQRHYTFITSLRPMDCLKVDGLTDRASDLFS